MLRTTDGFKKMISSKVALILAVSILALISLCGSSQVAYAQGRIYVANFPSDNVSVLDTSSNTVVATVAVGTQPQGGGRHPGRNARLGGKLRRRRLGDRHVDQQSGHQGGCRARPHGGGSYAGRNTRLCDESQRERCRSA
jgi:YVTN family beta-propeller protein